MQNSMQKNLAKAKLLLKVFWGLLYFDSPCIFVVVVVVVALENRSKRKAWKEKKTFATQNWQRL